MNETNKQLITLIQEGKTLNQIANNLKLSHKQIYMRLRNLRLQGFDYIREYFYDGNIRYSPINLNDNTNKEISLITKSTDQQITIMLISDIHLGSIYDRIDLLNKVYDYCLQNNIHIIINAGDIVDGINIRLKKRHTSFDEQIDYALKNYPFDPSILNFICLGNHDMDYYQNNNQDITNLLYNYRHDLISLGYSVGSINIKNEKLFVKHHISGYKPDKIPNGNLILLGHSHKASICYNGNLSIHIPTLCDIKSIDRLESPGATLMTISFENGFFKTGFFQQFIIDNSFHTVNEFRCDILPNRTIKRDNQILFEMNKYGQYIKQKKK